MDIITLTIDKAIVNSDIAFRRAECDTNKVRHGGSRILMHSVTFPQSLTLVEQITQVSVY